MGLHSSGVWLSLGGDSLPVTVERLVSFRDDEDRKQVDHDRVHLPVGDGEVPAIKLLHFWLTFPWLGSRNSGVQVNVLSQVLAWSIDEECGSPSEHD